MATVMAAKSMGRAVKPVLAVFGAVALWRAHDDPMRAIALRGARHACFIRVAVFA